MQQKLNAFFTDNKLRMVAYGIILLGITLRCIFYLQNRCLFIDEANVARNIYERGFLQLTLPLSYEQYAPPLFLWVIKCFVLVLGNGELSYRFFTFLSGIASLWLMLTALRKYTTLNALWYPLFIMATGFIYIRYSAELKQYICDVDVALGLLLIALYTDVIKTGWMQFLLLWFVLGTVTIWLSMPGVFMLAGVGAYYAYIVARDKVWGKLGGLALLGAAWLAQFGLYYLLILKPQIQSDYLQFCHKDFFLYALPGSMQQLTHNIDVIISVLANMGGKWAIPVAFHILALVCGWGYLFKKQTAKAILITVPMVVLLAAAAAHQYALTARLILFIMPLLLIVVGCGLGVMLRVKLLAAKTLLVVVACLCVFLSAAFDLFYTRHDNEQMTESLKYLTDEHLHGDHIFVHNLAGPAYIYYTTIHPARAQWQSLANAPILFWNTNYDSLGNTAKERSAILYSWETDEEIARQRALYEKSNKQEAEHIVTGGRVYVYRRKYEGVR